LKARMENLPITSIEFGERARTDMGDLQALASSIQTEGLINPVTVIDCAAAGIDCKMPFLLMAGGRRYYTAWKFLNWETIPCRIYEEKLSGDQLKMIELVENLQRKSMTPAEELALKTQIHTLQIKTRPEKIARTTDNVGYSIAETAKILNIDRTTLSKDLKLQQTMDLFPDVDWTVFKNKNEIQKTLEKLKRTVTNQVKACEVEKNLGANPKQKLLDLACKCYLLNDFFEGVKSVESHSVDFVEIDPPFGIDLPNNKKGKDTGSYNEVAATSYVNFINRVMRESFRVMKRDSFGILWFAPEPWTCLEDGESHSNILTEALKNTGFSYCGIPAVWFKAKDETSQSSGQTNMPSNRLATSCEYFYYFWRGTPKLNRPGMTNGFNYRPVPPAQKYHPTQKPVELYNDIYTTFVGPGSRCMIPFLGSGVSLLSAFQNGMTAFGWELSEDFRNAFIVKAQEIFGGGKQ